MEMVWAIVIALVIGLISVGLEKRKDAQAAKKAEALNASRPLSYADLDLDDDDDKDENLLSEAGSLRISYVDEKGNSTERDITIYEFGATNRKFQAYCSLRKDTRDFLFERIEYATDLDTGEVLGQADVFRRVHPGRKVPATLV